MPPAELNRVLVASRTGDDRKTLATVRALAGPGIAVTVASSSRASSARYSRFCSRFIQLPDPADDMEGFVAALRRDLQANPQDVVLALCDYTTHAVARHRDELGRLAGLCVPEAQQLAIASDKAQVLELADSLGIGIPKTCCIRSAEDLSLACASTTWPCVFKLRRGSGGVGRQFPDSAASLMQAYAELQERTDAVFDSRAPLVQEYVPGEIHDVCALFRHGEPRAVLSQKRLAMFPAEGGVGVYNETTRDPELIRQAVELLAALRWHGPAQVEFKRDARDGRMRLLEINPRFWGTLDLSIQAGVNFPHLAALIAVRGDVEASFEYRVGMRMRWLYCYDAPDRPAVNLQGRAILDALSGGDSARTDLWLTDPLPHIARLVHTGTQSLKRSWSRA